jgi:hypothetical protein
MSQRCLTFAIGLTAVVSLAQGQVSPDRASAKTKIVKQSWTAPRAADGHPDLEGFWANNIATPLERPPELAGREFLTDAEVAAMKKKAAELFNGEGDAAFGDEAFRNALANVNGTKSGFKSSDTQTGNYSSVWTVERVFDNRTSLITEPRDGRLPPMTPEGTMVREANGAALKRLPHGPEDRTLAERCITYGSPQLIAGYQSYYQIRQTPSAVVFMTEMIHDTRMIPLGAGPHAPSSIHQWLGDSRGHWEGDTLVVDTTNYKPKSFMGISSEKLRVTERFSRTAADTLKYEITIDDPGTWTKPWSMMVPLQRSSKPVYEYACHEGNYGMTGILAGARAQELAAGSASSRQ